MTDRGATPPLILLAGLRASGKSTIGPLLAARLSLPFFDLDHQTAALLRGSDGFATASELFQARGELAFRAAECDAFARACSVEALAAPRVLALGGGTLMQGAVQESLRAERQRSARAICVILLDPSIETMRERLRADAGHRPSLTGASVIDEVAEIAAARLGVYRTLADAVVAESSSPEATTVACIAAIALWNARQAAS